ncbi:MAG: hypothetical protein AAF439_15755 [Pseudomonadota bacterium]
MINRYVRFVLVGLLAIIAFPLAAASQNGQLWMLDFVYLANGKTLADRDAYNETARPIAANHGAELQVTLDRMTGATGPLLGGPLLPERLDLWTMQTVHGLQSWGTDPAFQAILPRALEVHDMQQLSVYLSQQFAMTEFADGSVYLVDTLTFPSGDVDTQAVSAYLNAFRTQAKVHQIELVAAFGNVRQASGGGPRFGWMSAFRVPSEQAWISLINDPAIADLEATRQQLVDTADSTRALYAARAVPSL